ncbi:MAG TPA: magnesium transporter CorA family protein [Candidatus Nanoarchaeia archaeon]|nr:magnesium transporter CorA family protein [Candidatus Nanoarchaeia archaeon]
MSQYKKISSNIQQLTISGVGGQKIKWLNIANPGKNELSFLRKIRIYDFDFKQLRASSVKIQAQRPIFEQREKYFFLILQFPVFRNGEIAAAEIDFFISHGLLVTLHGKDVPVLDELFNTAKKDDSILLAKKMPSAAILLCELLSKLIFHCYDLMDKNSKQIDEIEKIIFSNQQKKAASAILELRRNIIAIRRIMQSHKNILKKITRTKSQVISSAKLNHYYFELIEHTKRIWELSENQKEAVEALYDTNQSMLNYNINNVIKILTIFSVVMYPLSIIASMFGMNVVSGMPFLNSPHGFWIVSAIMALCGSVMLLIFARKKWL